jgi:ABC-type taurine transport system ATPase subunit
MAHIEARDQKARQCAPAFRAGSSEHAGAILIAGQRVGGCGMNRGVVFQDFAQLLPWRTALGNVAFGLEIKRWPNPNARRSRSSNCGSSNWYAE